MGHSVGYCLWAAVPKFFENILKYFPKCMWNTSGIFFNACIFDNVFPDIIPWPSSSAPAECQLNLVKLVGCGRRHDSKWRELLTRCTTCVFLSTLMSPWRTAEPLMVGTSCCVIRFLSLKVLYLVLCLLQVCIYSESVCFRVWITVPSRWKLVSTYREVKPWPEWQDFFLLMHSIAMRWMLIIENINQMMNKKVNMMVSIVSVRSCKTLRTSQYSSFLLKYSSVSLN